MAAPGIEPPTLRVRKILPLVGNIWFIRALFAWKTNSFVPKESATVLPRHVWEIWSLKNQNTSPLSLYFWECMVTSAEILDVISGKIPVYNHVDHILYGHYGQTDLNLVVYLVGRCCVQLPSSRLLRSGQSPVGFFRGRKQSVTVVHLERAAWEFTDQSPCDPLDSFAEVPGEDAAGGWKFLEECWELEHSLVHFEEVLTKLRINKDSGNFKHLRVMVLEMSLLS